VPLCKNTSEVLNRRASGYIIETGFLSIMQQFINSSYK